MSSEEVKPEEISSSEISTSIQESVIEPITDGIVLKSCRKVYSGEYVVLRINEGLKYIVIRASENGSFKVNKKINLKQSQLIGCYIGAFYEVIGGVLKQTEEQKSLVDMVGEGVEEIRETKDPNEVDNRHLVQNTQSQKLSAEEIVQMKDKGISSAELLKKIAENSETFQAKTAFSQEKYLRRKQKKYRIST